MVGLGLQLPPRRAARRAAALAPARACEADIERRRELTRALPRAARGVDGLIVPYTDDAVEHSSCYVMPVLVEDATRRDAVRTPPARAHGVQTSALLSRRARVHRLPRALRRAALPRTERVARAEITLPLFPDMTEAKQDRVVDALRGGAGMTWDIPLTDVILDEEDIEAVADCLRSGWLTMGPRTQAFEAAVAEHTGVAARRRRLAAARPRCTSPARRWASARATR